jgi:hypothetical protein
MDINAYGCKILTTYSIDTLFTVCVNRIQGGNVWIFERTLASKKYSVCVSEEVSDQPLTYVSIGQIGSPVKRF